MTGLRGDSDAEGSCADLVEFGSDPLKPGVLRPNLCLIPVSA